jgi:hypothetical protein
MQNPPNQSSGIARRTLHPATHPLHRAILILPDCRVSWQALEKKTAAMQRVCMAAVG